MLPRPDVVEPPIGVALAISLLYSASVAAGVIVTILALAAVGAFVFWWVRLGGCYKVGVNQKQGHYSDLFSFIDCF